MKYYLTILFLVLSIKLFSQISDREEAQRFWQTNVQAVINLDQEVILNQTRFPLNISTDQGNEKWNKETFKAKLALVFNEKIRKELSKENIDFIDAWVMSEDSSDTYMLIFLNPTDTFEAVVFSFMQFEGLWKLYGIDYQKE